MKKGRQARTKSYSQMPSGGDAGLKGLVAERCGTTTTVSAARISASASRDQAWTDVVRKKRTHAILVQSIDNRAGGAERFREYLPRRSNGKLNRCLFFITPLISYATPVLFRI